MVESVQQSGNEIVMSQLINSINAGVYSLGIQDGNCVCNFVNSLLCEWTGQPAEAFVGQINGWLVKVHPGDQSRVAKAYQNVVVEGQSLSLEYRIQGKDQISISVEDTIRPIFDPAGQDVIGLIGCVLDMTFVKQAQQELERTQLLQSMGRLVAGIAHEINTPVQFIGDNLQFLSDAWQMVQQWVELMGQCIEQLQENDEISEQIGPWLERIETFKHQADTSYVAKEFPVAVAQSLEGVERVSKLVSAMRDFSHMDERRMAPANMNQAIDSTLTILRNELKYTTDVETDFDQSLPELYCAIDELNQVFLNLLVNASHSIQEKIDQNLYQRGLIRVRTCLEDDMVVLSFTDNGTGIDPDIQHRIFDRFFTTKRHHPDRRGTGQGLAMVHSIVVERHQGQINVDSQAGEGTTFTLRLPLKKQCSQKDEMTYEDIIC